MLRSLMKWLFHKIKVVDSVDKLMELVCADKTVTTASAWLSTEKAWTSPCSSCWTATAVIEVPQGKYLTIQARHFLLREELSHLNEIDHDEACQDAWRRSEDAFRGICKAIRQRPSHYGGLFLQT